MTALADFPAPPAGPRARRGHGSRGPSLAAVPGAVPAADRSGAVRNQAKTVRSWPLLVLAVPAAAEVRSGWVGIAQLTGFGVVPLLPGIWPSVHLDTAVTLPVGIECYAAYALRRRVHGRLLGEAEEGEMLMVVLLARAGTSRGRGWPGPSRRVSKRRGCRSPGTRPAAPGRRPPGRSGGAARPGS